MAGLFRGRNIGGAETETVAPPVVTSSESTRKRRVEAHQFRFVGGGVLDLPFEKRRKEQKIEVVDVVAAAAAPVLLSKELRHAAEPPKFGMTSVCGRRRDMEDEVAIHPSFFQAKNGSSTSDLHFFGVYDGHGCSHVATRCKNRMHEIVGEELLTVRSESSPWTEVMKKSFNLMDNEIINWSTLPVASTTACRCELQPPLCDAVGSTAVVAVVTPDKIVVSNSGDSRAVLCRNGKAIPLSVDHKPDRPDEMKRIQEAGGRIIYWDGPRVQGFLAMSRAIGDSYLKPYVISDPEVTVTNRSEGDECLILASDGLWDAVSNETACSVARMCLRTREPPHNAVVGPSGGAGGEESSSDKACSDASVLLTKLALARGSCDNTSVVVVDLRRNL